MRGRTIEWEDEKQKSLVQHIVDTSHKISMKAAGRGNSGIIFAPYVSSLLRPSTPCLMFLQKNTKRCRKNDINKKLEMLLRNGNDK